MEETWCDIVDFPNYAVSSFGRLYNKSTERFLSIQFNRANGYEQVSLWRNNHGFTFYVHRLVAAAFCYTESEDLEVNHLDGNKRNNAFWNLEWVTRSANHKHAYRSGIREPVRNMRNVKCTTTGEEFESILACARYFNVSRSAVSNCLAGRRNSCRGLTFEYT